MSREVHVLVLREASGAIPLAYSPNEILSADHAGWAQERDDQPQDVPGYSDDRSRQLQHALIMPE